MATQTINKITDALALLSVINQATTDKEIRKLCVKGSETIGLLGIVTVPDVDPAAKLQNIKLDPIYDAINECNSIADASSSKTVKQGCQAIIQSLTAIIQKLI